jgi:hypothetical protein
LCRTLIRVARRLGAAGTVIMLAVVNLIFGSVQTFFALVTGVFGARDSAAMEDHNVKAEKNTSEEAHQYKRESNSPAKWLNTDGPKEPLIELKGNAAAEGEIKIL